MAHKISAVIRRIADAVLSGGALAFVTLFIAACGSAAAWFVFGPASGDAMRGLLWPVAVMCASGGACVWPQPLVIIASGLIFMVSTVVYLVWRVATSIPKSPDNESVILIGLLWWAYNTIHWNDRPAFIRILASAQQEADFDDVLDMLKRADLASDRPLVADDFPITHDVH